MMNNDVMRSLRYTMKVNDQKLAEIIALAGGSTAVEEIHNMLLSENIMAYFLDGLIYFKRGKDESKPPMPFEFPITNNVILKKIRVAFELKEDDIHEILKSADCPLGRSELSALMRKKGHPNYRECGDQIMRYFLKGLQKKFRP
jgi:uncharacterized protein YehS (DUF1456 family)